MSTDAAQPSDTEPDAITGRGHIAKEGGPKLPWTSWWLTHEKNPVGIRPDFSKDNTVLKHNRTVQGFLNSWDWVLVAIQPCQQIPFFWQTYLSVIIQGLCVSSMVSTEKSKAQPLLHSPSGFTHLSKSQVPWELQADVYLDPGAFKLPNNFFKVSLLKSFVLQLLLWQVWSEEFGFSIWEEKEARGSIITLQSCGAWLARSYTWDLQEGSPKRSTQSLEAWQNPFIHSVGFIPDCYSWQ